jgi:hypothetical protein
VFVLLRFTDSDVPLGIFKLFSGLVYPLSMNLWMEIVDNCTIYMNMFLC